MKKFVTVFIMAICMVFASCNSCHRTDNTGFAARRCAVLDFKARVGISQSDVDGISVIFTTYFRPDGYTMVERAQIDKVIEEQKFQRSCLTESQMVRIGQILNVSKIVVGDINVVMGQYNVDVRVINVETGTIAATEGATFATTAYRANMQKIAQKLAAKIDSTVSSYNESIEPYVIYGYLKVYPTDIGTFDDIPRNIISKLNQSMPYGYGTWRLPTNEELSLMRADNIVGNEKYMTKERHRGIVRLVTDKEKGEMLPSVPVGYVDLGLPSGTLWKDKNEDLYYEFDAAVRIFGGNLPSREQFEELQSECKWSWTGSGYNVTGPNGKSIVLPAAGFRSCGTSAGYRVGDDGNYWTSLQSSPTGACLLYFDSDGVRMRNYDLCDGCSIRLVQ